MGTKSRKVNYNQILVVIRFHAAGNKEPCSFLHIFHKCVTLVLYFRTKNYTVHCIGMKSNHLNLPQ